MMSRASGHEDEQGAGHSAESDAWFVWLPIRQKWVVLASEIEARDFAEKFGGTTVTRDIPPAECAHCGQPLPHAGTSWRESGACRRNEACVLPPTVPTPPAADPDES